MKENNARQTYEGLNLEFNTFSQMNTAGNISLFDISASDSQSGETTPDPLSL